jgi:DNA-binding XRE family transcriptional regulator
MELKEARKKILRMSQVDLALVLGVSERTYIRYEKDGAPAPILKLVGMLCAQAAKKKGA